MFNDIKYRSFISVVIIIIITFYINFNYSFWKNPGRIISWDIIDYYSYLPATFIYNDVTLKFTETNTGKFSNKIWGHKLKNGNYFIKMSMGLSMMYAPFFGIAHTLAKPLGYENDGYSSIYEFFLVMASIFYLLIGLIVLRKILLKYYSDIVTSITIIIITLGTNLLYYATSEAAMSHVFSFCLFSLFIYFSILWNDKPSWLISIALGLLLGLISLIRPTNSIVIGFFVLWYIYNLETLKDKVKIFIKNFFKLVLIGFFAFIIWVPQFLYWKHISGSWIFYSYGDEGFFFNDPQIINVLFSYRKGWFVYTPIMMLIIPGFIVLFRKSRKMFFAPFVFVCINLYLVSSWWCWWYGGSFSMRSLIESYAFLGFPLAAFVAYILSKKYYFKISYIVLIVLLVMHSLFQTAQYHYSAIHWDSMSKKSYWNSFGRLHPNTDFQNQIETPNYDKAIKGERD